MLYNYNFYIEDTSFDYGDFPNSTCYCEAWHGFSIDIDVNNIVNIDTLKPYGDYSVQMKDIKTIEKLADFLEQHLDEVQENEDEDLTYSNKECFIELIDFLKEQEQRKCA